MTYDAVLTARRGLDPDGLRLVSAAFAAAVRWAAFAERLGTDLPELRRAVASDPPWGMAGAELVEFLSRRSALRADLERTEAALYPPDPDDG